METGGLEFRRSSTQFEASLGFLGLKKREGEKKEGGREEKKETRKERERMK